VKPDKLGLITDQRDLIETASSSSSLRKSSSRPTKKVSTKFPTNNPTKKEPNTGSPNLVPGSSFCPSSSKPPPIVGLKIACNFFDFEDIEECKAATELFHYNDYQPNRTIPKEIGYLTQATYLRLDGLSGTIPSQLFCLTKLRGLISSGTEMGKLAGTIPARISSLKHLDDLSFEYNQLSGTIPTSISALTKLTQLNFPSNKFKGNLEFLSSLTNLKYISLTDNRMTGTIPTFFTRMPNLYWLDVVRNKLTGTLPSVLLKMEKLNYIYISDNNLVGNIPSCYGKRILVDCKEIICSCCRYWNDTQC
jgi:Leucine-rich repeat (LRR) protein